MYSYIVAIVFLALLQVAGYLYVSSFSRSESRKFNIGASVILGYVLYILMCLFLGINDLWIPVVATLVIGGGVYVASRLFVTEQNTKEVFSFSYSGIFAILIVFFSYLLGCYFSFGYDELNHFSFASQISREKFPPSVFAFPDLAAKYHYGWATLLAGLSKTSSLSLPICTDVLTLHSLMGCLLMLDALFERENVTRRGRNLGILLFFFGGGGISIASKIFLNQWKSGLSLFSMYHQHPWVFGVSIFLIILNVISIFGGKKHGRNLWLLLITVPLVVLTPIINATSGPFILLTLLITAVIILLKEPSLKGKCLVLICVVLIMLMYYGWQKIGGMLIIGQGYDKPRFSLAINVFDIKNYLKYELAYILLLAPIGLLAWLLSLGKVLRFGFGLVKKENVFNCYLFGYTLVLFPFPILVMVENAAYWDNFCKINYLGILSGWLVLLLYIERKGSLQKEFKYSPLQKMLVFIVFLFVFNESLILLYRQVVGMNEHEVYNIAVKNKHELLNYVNDNIPLSSNILILNKDVDEMYKVSKDTNKAQVNLYGFIAKNYGDFRVLAMETGSSIVNFYDYNFLYNRENEYRLRDSIGAAFSGDFSLLKDVGVDMVLCSISKCPSFLSKLEDNRVVIRLEESEEEHWRIYKIVDP